MIKNHLWIGGNQILRSPVEETSPFYEDYRYYVAQASALDVAAAIGAARKANRGQSADRSEALQMAADRFTISDEEIEHTVRLTGMPVAVVIELLEDVRSWLREVPQAIQTRFQAPGGEKLGADTEWIDAHTARVFAPEEGICYAVTPGNDPRSAALVAANLCYLGIPFIIKASNRDAIAPRVVQALIAGGFDPNFCSLLYFDNRLAAHHHFRLVDASATIWTFGPQSRVDSLLRYETLGRRVYIDIPHSGAVPDSEQLRRLVGEDGVQVESAYRDHFSGKRVLRHDSGNCALIASGELAEDHKQYLHQAIRFPLGCNATRAAFLVQPGDWVERAAEIFAGLRPGDPLDPRTEIGLISEHTLDTIDGLVQKNRLRSRVYGGERLSRFQARPLLIACQETVADFFAQEIPGYVLALRDCSSLVKAIDEANRHVESQPRLAVSLYNLDASALETAVRYVRAHALMVEQPTSRVIPYFHEGNDYAVSLRPGRIVVYN